MEYSTNVEKLQAMKRCDHMSKSIFSTLVYYSLLPLVLALFLSSPLRIPILFSSLKLFLSDSLPKLIAVVSGPKCIFVVFNLIIIFLVGEARLKRSSSKLDIYEEYVIHNKSLKGLPSDEGKLKESVTNIPLVEEKEEVVKKNVLVLVLESPLVEEKEEEELKETVESVEEEVKVESKVLVEEEEEELAAEELNRKVEAFIAMVNMQMRLEARMVLCCG